MRYPVLRWVTLAESDFVRPIRYNRAEAVKKAKEKVELIAQSSGLRLG